MPATKKKKNEEVSGGNSGKLRKQLIIMLSDRL